MTLRHDTATEHDPMPEPAWRPGAAVPPELVDVLGHVTKINWATHPVTRAPLVFGR